MIKLLAISFILLTSCEIAEPVPPFGTLKFDEPTNITIGKNVSEYVGSYARLVKYPKENGCETNCFDEEVGLVLTQDSLRISYNSSYYYGLMVEREIIECPLNEGI